jgi:hypothetical protein
MDGQRLNTSSAWVFGTSRHYIAISLGPYQFLAQHYDREKSLARIFPAWKVKEEHPL